MPLDAFGGSLQNRGKIDLKLIFWKEKVVNINGWGRGDNFCFSFEFLLGLKFPPPKLGLAVNEIYRCAQTDNYFYYLLFLYTS